MQHKLVVDQSLSHIGLFATPWTAAHQAPPSSSISQSLLKFVSLSQWCYLTSSSSAAPFSFCLQSFPASGSFPMSWLFASRGQIIGASASASVLPMNIQGWFPLGLTGFLSLKSKGLTLKSLIQHHSSKALILQHSAFLMVKLSHPYMTTGKTTALTIQTFVGKVMFLLSNTLSRFVIPRFPSKEQASFNFMAAATVCKTVGKV